MNILYLGYWNLGDPLTHATVFPNLKTLCRFSWVSRIVFVNIERELKQPANLPVIEDKIIYRPFFSRKSNQVFLEKFGDFIKAPEFIISLIKEYKIDCIIARGSLAGGLAYRVHSKTGIQFYVESFEPHADYMIESKIWKWYDPRVFIEKYFESKQIQLASGLMPVALNYSQKLVAKGVDVKKIKTVPCLVDSNAFRFSKEDRDRVRHQLGIPNNALVGIYAGRFGGLYLEEEAFTIYKLAFEFFQKNFYLIVLTPKAYHVWVKAQAEKYELPSDRVYTLEASHSQVPAFLSASDFGFATYKTGDSKAYLSPVKIGEYWANGLPVLMTKGVGDETQIIEKYPFAGALFEFSRIKHDSTKLFGHLMEIIQDNGNRTKISELALTFRSPEFVTEAYDFFLNRGVK